VNPFDVGIGPPGQARTARGDGPLSNRADFCWRRLRSAFSAEAERSSAADRILHSGCGGDRRRARRRNRTGNCNSRGEKSEAASVFGAGFQSDDVAGLPAADRRTAPAASQLTWPPYNC